MIHLSEIAMVVVESTAAYISSYLMAELAEARIPVVFCDIKHNPIGQYSPIYGAHDSTRRIGEQISWNKKLGDELWRRIVKSKINNQASVLKKMGLAQFESLEEYARNVSAGDATNREGHAAKVYFNALFGKNFNRDAENSINAQLNYGYAILLAWFNREITSRGYLTQVGIHHCNDYNHFNLSCDFMEPFRPVVDLYVAENYERGLEGDVKREILSLFSEYRHIEQGSYRIASIISLFTKQNLAILGGRAELGSYLEFSLDEE